MSNERGSFEDHASYPELSADQGVQARPESRRVRPETPGPEPHSGVSGPSGPDGPGKGDAGAGGGGGRKLLVPVAMTFAALVGFGAIVWYAYTWGLDQAERETIPIVAGAPIDEKTKPEDPGGRDVPYQDQLVMNQESASSSTQIERLLLPAEEPIVTQQMLPRLSDGTRTTIGKLEQEADSEASSIIEEVEEKTEAVIKEVEVKAESLVRDVQEATSPEPADKAEKPVEKPAAEPAIQPAEKLKSVVRDAESLPKGSFVVQLSALRSQEEAEKEWLRLQAKHKALLGQLNLIVQKIDLGEQKGTFFRVQTGPFPNKVTAEDMCVQLRNQGTNNCFVKKR